MYRSVQRESSVNMNVIQERLSFGTNHPPYRSTSNSHVHAITLRAVYTCYFSASLARVGHELATLDSI